MNSAIRGQIKTRAYAGFFLCNDFTDHIFAWELFGLDSVDAPRQSVIL